MDASEKREGVWTIREEGRRLVADGYSLPRDPTTGKREVDVIPADAPNVLSEEEARLVRHYLAVTDDAVAEGLVTRLRAFAEGKTDV